MSCAAKHPARQLNSKTIRDSAASYLLPYAQPRFCLVSAKCIWRVATDSLSSLRKAWELICEKRQTTDNAISSLPNVAFFFSAVSSSETRRKHKTSSQNGQEDEILPSQEPEDEVEDGRGNYINIAVQKMRYPALAYWIAMESANGAQVSLYPLRRKLIGCDLEIDSVKVLGTARKAKGADATSSLCNVLKDHNSSYMMGLVNESFRHCADEVTDELDCSQDFDEDDLSENVVRFVLRSSQFANPFVEILASLRAAGLEMDVEGVPMSNEQQLLSALVQEQIQSRSMTRDPTTQLICDIERIMKRLGYALYRGLIYKKEPTAKYTFSYKCEVDAFIGTLEGNEGMKSRLVKHGHRLRNKLCNPESQLIRQIDIDHDLVEVSEGWCLSITERKFLPNALAETDVGRRSPRAYFGDFKHNTNPQPKYFREILEHSLTPEDITRFCEDFVGLLKFQQKRHKEKVPCAIGPANSGKTSLFAPILGIVNPRKLARVTKQREFNKSMITEETEVIFIDEAYPGLMSEDDWKLLMQGGWTVHDTKYETAKAFNNRAPMFIGCQRPMKFPRKEDQQAIDSRMNKYYFTSLPTTDPQAFSWLQNNPLHCILWAMEQIAETDVPDATLQEKSTTSTCQLSSKDKMELLHFDFVRMEDTESFGKRVAESDGKDDLTVPPLAHESSFQERLLARIETKKESDREAHRVARLDQRRRYFVDMGILSATQAERVVVDNDELPEYVRLREEAVFAARREERMVEKQKNLDESFGNAWLAGIEKMLHEHSLRVLESPTSRSMVEILANKLNMYHGGKCYEGRDQEALDRRCQLLAALGVISGKNGDAVSDLYSPVYEMSNEYTPPTPSPTVRGGVPTGWSSEVTESTVPLTPPSTAFFLEEPPRTPDFRPRNPPKPSRCTSNSSSSFRSVSVKRKKSVKPIERSNQTSSKQARIDDFFPTQSETDRE